MELAHHELFKGPFGTLEDFVDRISDLLRCPVTLEDAHHRVLAYSSHDEATDTARVSTIIRRQVPEKVINHLWKDGTIPNLLNQKAPVLVKQNPDIGLSNRVAVSIWKGEEVLGFIWVIEVDRSLDNDDDFALLQKAADIAGNLLMHQKIQKQHQDGDTSEFFWQLLTGHLTNRQTVIHKAYELGVIMPKYFTVMIFRFDTTLNDDIDTQVAYLLKTTDKVSVPLYINHHKELIILAGCEESQTKPLEAFKLFAQMFQKHMADRFGVEGIHGGFGGRYHDVAHIAKSYREAQTVLKVHEQFPSETADLFSYQELGIYQFLDILYERRNEDGFENIAIKQLKDYDVKHNTKLLNTLECFLNADENMQKTAEKLHVHINTLGYRLKRITEVGEIDLTQPHQKLMLYLDLKLLKWKS